MVLHLRGAGKIKYDSDIVRATGYSKSIVSAYIKNTQAPSDEFMEVFRNVYDKDLKAIGTDIDPIKVKEVEQEYRDKYIKSLVKTIKMQDELLDILRAKLKKYEG